MSERNYDALVSLLATDTTARLERAIKKSSFNRLGGLVLDQEIRALCSYLTASTSWSVRDKMVRLTQIATILNLEKVRHYWRYFFPKFSFNFVSLFLPNSDFGNIRVLESSRSGWPDCVEANSSRSSIYFGVEVFFFVDIVNLSFELLRKLVPRTRRVLNEGSEFSKEDAYFQY